jgi:hypothetical protein
MRPSPSQSKVISNGSERRNARFAYVGLYHSRIHKSEPTGLNNRIGPAKRARLADRISVVSLDDFGDERGCFGDGRWSGRCGGESWI